MTDIEAYIRHSEYTSESITESSAIRKTANNVPAETIIEEENIPIKATMIDTESDESWFLTVKGKKFLTVNSTNRCNR